MRNIIVLPRCFACRVSLSFGRLHNAVVFISCHTHRERRSLMSVILGLRNVKSGLSIA
jgi:hypothetical protein